MNTSASCGEIAWGILGTGGIAHTFAEGLGKCRKGRLVAVGSRKQESADEFVKKFGSARACGNYESVLTDPTVDIVYISTPNPQHAEWCLKAARAKKHILCEKPLTMNFEEAQMVVEVARENGVFLMEAFMYRCHPQTMRLIELIHSGVIGRIGIIRATYSSNVAYNAEDRRFNKALGGGGILDLGCYATSISRLIAGAAQGLPFSNPEEIMGFAQIHPEGGSDIYAVGSVRFPGGILAQLSAGVGLKQGSSVQIYGTEGMLEIPKPFVMARNGGTSSIFLTRERSSQPEEIIIQADNYLWAIEADSVAECLLQGRLENPCMTQADSLGNMAALDAWRLSAGLI